MAQTETALPLGWRVRWPSIDDIAAHDEGASEGGRGWWLARCSREGLDGLLLVGFFDDERQFTICSPSVETNFPVDTWTTTVAPGWSFCPVDEWGLPGRQPKTPGLAPELALADLRLDYLLAVRALDDHKALLGAAHRQIEAFEKRVFELTTPKRDTDLYPAHRRGAAGHSSVAEAQTTLGGRHHVE